MTRVSIKSPSTPVIMSVRPRPVTATINHKPQYESTPVRSDRSYSPYSTGDSTHSLISVLDHDSFDDLDDDNCQKISDEAAGAKAEDAEAKAEDAEPHLINDDQKVAKIAKQKDNKEIRNEIKQFAEMNMKDSSDNRKAFPVKRRADVDSEVEKSSIIDQEKALSPWEHWLIVKARQDREKLELIQKKKEEETRIKELKQRDHVLKLKKAEAARNEWIEKKLRQEKMQKLTKEQKERMQKELKAEEKRHIEEKSKQKYIEWTEKKKEEEAARKLKLDEKKQRDEAQRMERRASSEKAFIAWKERAATRPKSAPSYPILAGKHAGYLDGASYPAPSYVNPIPWQPTPGPPPKTQRKKRVTKPKKAWDPCKYY